MSQRGRCSSYADTLLTRLHLLLIYLCAHVLIFGIYSSRGEYGHEAEG
jgi:hypothetical protein